MVVKHIQGSINVILIIIFLNGKRSEPFKFQWSVCDYEIIVQFVAVEIMWYLSDAKNRLIDRRFR